MANVCVGIRPEYPTSGFSEARGLNERVWAIIQCCWSEDAGQRPSTMEVEKKIASLPTHQQDRRNVTDLEHLRSIPSQLARQDEVKHPFAELEELASDSPGLQLLKRELLRL